MISTGRFQILIGLVLLLGISLMGQDSWSELGPNDKRQKRPGASIVPGIGLLLLAEDRVHYVPQPVTVVPVEDTSILHLLEGKTFVFDNAAFLHPALAGERVEVSYLPSTIRDRVTVIMKLDDGRRADGEVYVSSLILEILTSTIPGLVPGTYPIEQQLLIGSDGEAVTTLVIAGGTPGQSRSTPSFCEVLDCAGANLICDGVLVGACIVTGGFGG